MTKIIIDITGKPNTFSVGRTDLKIPRIGERLVFNDNAGTVANVVHNWDSVIHPTITIVINSD